MEQTNSLGRRISSLRKAQGWTQEQLAEKMGVSAQAVSKWENDLSCPDISALPLLASLFHVTTDELLGVKEAEPRVVVVEKEKEEPHKGAAHGTFTWEWNAKKGSGAAAALTAIAVALVLLGKELAPSRFPEGVKTWSLIWPVLIAGLGFGGLLSHKHAGETGFGLVCFLYGVYEFLYMYKGMPASWPKISWYAVMLVLAIVYLSVVLYWKLTGKTALTRRSGGRAPTMSFSCTDDRLGLDASFGGDTVQCDSSALKTADIDTSFGDYTVDFTAAHFEADARIKADVSFGNLCLLLPAGVSASVSRDASFGACSVHGAPENPSVTVFLQTDVSFGNIDIRYPNA